MWKLKRARCTFALEKYIWSELEPIKRYWLQISTKEPWLLPKKETVCKGEITLWGWLFFYIGCDTKMLNK